MAIGEVVEVRPSEWEKDGEKVITYWVTLEGLPTEVPCYDEAAAKLELGKPLPEGWEIRQSKKGKDYIATPKPRSGGGGGQAAWRNQREGFVFEQANMNARTALMQAVQAYGTTEPERVLFMADEYLEWLRKNVPAAQQSVPQGQLAAGQGTGADTTAPVPVPPKSPVTAGDTEGAAGEDVQGEGAPTPAAPRKSRAKPKDDNGTGWEYKPGDGHECEWIEAPRKGFVMCKWCGDAQRAA